MSLISDYFERMCWFSWFGKSRAFGIEGSLGLNVTFMIPLNKSDDSSILRRMWQGIFFFFKSWPRVINLGWGSNLNNRRNRVTQKEHHLSCFHLLKSCGCFSYRNYSCIYSFDKRSSGKLCAIMMFPEKHSVSLGWEDKLRSRNKYESHVITNSGKINAVPVYFALWPITKNGVLYYNLELYYFVSHVCPTIFRKIVIFSHEKHLRSKRFHLLLKD